MNNYTYFKVNEGVKVNNQRDTKDSAIIDEFYDPSWVPSSPKNAWNRVIHQHHVSILLSTTAGTPLFSLERFGGLVDFAHSK